MTETHRINRILVGTDFSDGSSAALDLALHIAKRHDASITILPVIPELPVSIPLSLQTQVEENLAAFAARAEGVDVPIETTFGTGQPWETIASSAEEADLVVVGDRGRTACTTRILGGTSDRVVRLCRSPVLVARSSRDATANGITTILAATDFSPEATIAIERAVELFDESDDRHLILLHVFEPVVDCVYDAVATIPYPTEAEVSESRVFLEQLAERYQTRGIEVTTRTALGTAASSIEEEAQRVGADLIALGTHGRSGMARVLLGSVAERVLHHATCPVLTVRHRDAGSSNVTRAESTQIAH